MDLRTIMNTDGGASNRQSAPQSSSSPIDASHQQQQQRAQSTSSRPHPHPAPPHPHHPSHASPDRAASYSGPVHSPYQQFNGGPPPLNTAIPPQQSQSPSQVTTPYGSGARDPYGASAYNSHPQHPQHPAAPLASPYTPQQPMSAGPQAPEQQSYFAQQRSHSLHSVMANPRAPAETFPNKESPPQPPPPHQFSPSAHRSVPGTPLGPPPNLASRQSPSSARPQSSGHDSYNPLSSPRPVADSQMRDLSQTQSPSAQHHFSPGTRPAETASHSHPSVKQEPLEHTTPQAPSRRNSVAAPSEAASSAPPRTSEDRKWNESPSTPFGSGPGSDARVSPIAATHSQLNSSPSGQRGGSHPLKMEVDHIPTSRVSSQPPKAKRRRYNEPPIYAQRSARTKGKCPIIPSPRPPVPKHARESLQESWAARRRSSTTGPPPPSASSSRRNRTPGAAPPSSNVPPAPPTASAPVAQTVPPSPAQEGALGIWEPSITGFIPHEEVTHELCDFLFRHVVARNDVGTGPAGAAAVGGGAIIEVEAKLGHIIDQDRRERLILPIKTEAIIMKETGGLRTSFESNMTVEQHRTYNNFLNETVKASMTPPRVPLSYAHKKERDTFYEVSPEELPPVIRSNLNPRHKPKVRVTTDQRTGEVLAKIVKCRVADLDVYSPRTAFDWRVSVNLEMEYEGDIRNLPGVDASKGGRGERNKDRMSYRHLAYQVDLTQVARADSAMKNEFDHELEIEISGAELKRQGQLAAAGDPKNQYEELVKGFVDNVRVLARVKS